MRVQKKLAKSLLLLIIALLVLGFWSVPAAADEEERGGLRINTDRIIKGQQEPTELRETELERVFPQLFTDETKEVIKEKELENKSELEQLEESIFFHELEGNTAVQDVKDALFAPEYEVAQTGGNQIQEDPSSGSGVSNTLLAVFTGLGAVLLFGLYAAMRNLVD